MQHIGIDRAFLSASGDLLSFSVCGGTEKIAGLWFKGVISTQSDTMITFSKCLALSKIKYERCKKLTVNYTSFFSRDNM